MRLVVLVCLFLASTACTARVRNADVTVDPPPVRVTVGEERGRFCPPGQAKKGTC
ncbi:MAG: hypothetical protein N3D77_01380 [Geminicoccaceae bacterium]|nr:hypothetical protein [Geminicoccaceae bacterium]